MVKCELVLRRRWQGFGRASAALCPGFGGIRHGFGWLQRVSRGVVVALEIFGSSSARLLCSFGDTLVRLWRGGLGKASAKGGLRRGSGRAWATLRLRSVSLQFVSFRFCLLLQSTIHSFFCSSIRSVNDEMPVSFLLRCQHHWSTETSTNL